MKHMKKILAITLLLASLLSIALPGMAAVLGNNQPGKIQLSDTSTYVNMRAAANTSATIVARLGHGTTLTVLSSLNGSTVNGTSVWYYVRIAQPNGNTNASSGMTGYVHSSYVVPDDGSGSGVGSDSNEIDYSVLYKGLITTVNDPLDLHSEPSTSSGVVARARPGTSVEFYQLKANSNWYYIKNDSGQWGYGSAQYVKKLSDYSQYLPSGETLVLEGTCGSLGLSISNLELDKNLTFRVRFSRGIDDWIEYSSVTLYGQRSGGQSGYLFEPWTGYYSFKVWVTPQTPGTHAFQIAVRQGS